MVVKYLACVLLSVIATLFRIILDSFDKLTNDKFVGKKKRKKQREKNGSLMKN